LLGTIVWQSCCYYKSTTRHSLVSHYMSLSFASSHSPELLIHSSRKKIRRSHFFPQARYPIIDSWLPCWAGLPSSAPLHMSRKAAGDEHIAAPCHLGRDLTSSAKAACRAAEVMRRRAHGGFSDRSSDYCFYSLKKRLRLTPTVIMHFGYAFGSLRIRCKIDDEIFVASSSTPYVK
jgi:hypothetical protein